MTFICYFLNKGFKRAGKKLFDLALRGNANGKSWPIWGTCSGFELLVHLSINETDSLTICDSSGQYIPLNITSKFDKSKIGRTVRQYMHTILTTKNTTFNHHTKCLTPANFSNFEMDSFWNILSANHDMDGLEFISLIEAKEYPIWGSIFHPEKPAYEWTVHYTDWPKNINSVHAGSFFAEFFVEQARKNNHKFIDRQTEEKYLIYNHMPHFTGNIKWAQHLCRLISFNYF